MENNKDEISYIFTEDGFDLLLSTGTEQVKLDLSTYEGVEALYQSLIGMRSKSTEQVKKASSSKLH